ncbi:unnamed protein product [Lepeophtheirus salmonis]|uniref:(salmon louse) hypothetical protein n=1 Tax=Lepeophtheirus salmonis TaxID=72036 RepID=A0A7R8CRS7_LEPSM|nr:unnamed protein product [Lepeophtheirus salmonis]CAF2910071.1 unnamed protein product [Lepeophtheirus salmonis]
MKVFSNLSWTLLFCVQISQSTTLFQTSERRDSGVKLGIGRRKGDTDSGVRDNANYCPGNSEYEMYCKCKSRKKGLDITCRDVDMEKLKADCVKLKSKERNIRYFKINDSYLPKLEDYLFLGLKIEHLIINNCSIRSVSRSALSSQGNTLKHLVMSDNKFEEIPSHAIRGLRELEHLNLNSNLIKVVRNEAFKGLSKVTRLSLYNNQIHKIENNAFDGLTRDLIRLNLVRNDLKSVPHSSINNLKNLDRLDLSENKIDEIHAGEFYGLEKLDTLILNDNQITALTENNFEDLDGLTSLYLDRNQISQIHENAFIGLEENLQSLTLTGNKLTEFPNDNSVTTIYENSFQGFGEHIRNLWFQNNHINNIPAPAFQYLHSLEWIKLYNNE